MTTTIVKISVLALTVFAVAGLVFAGIGQSASAFLNNFNNGHNHNHQSNNCANDCNDLKTQNNQNNQGSSGASGNGFTA
ncbi:MAG: hypothetical protein M3Z01_05585 [Thermoproteota archaeon]|nr:hypothetical protein [Thermoproteota archaeon]